MLRTFAAAALAATSLVATLVAAQPADRPAQEPLTRTAVEQRAAAMFARLDADGDARLTPADRTAREEQRQDDRFARLDTDGNGALSREEFAAGAEHRNERMGERRAGPGAEGRDQAGEHRPRGGMARMDGPRGMRGGPRQMMARADTDGDGAVTQAEFTGAMLARFDAADADRNGTISPEERRAHRRPDRPATR